MRLFTVSRLDPANRLQAGARDFCQQVLEQQRNVVAHEVAASKTV